MKRRRLWLILPLVILPIIIFRSQVRERPLLERATILEKNRPRYQDFDSPYLWLSDSRILFIDSTPKGYKARVRDIQTGQDEPYHGKGTFFGNRSIDDTIFRLSPDKKRLLWVSNGEVIATDSDGKELGKWNRQLGQAMYVKEWMPDSLHWVEAIEKGNGTYAKIHGIGEADKPEQKIQGLGDGWFFGFTSRQILLTVNAEYTTNLLGQYQILEVSLTNPIQSNTISLPTSVSAQDIVISLQGDKLAWLSKRTKSDSFIAQWLGKLRLSQPLDETIYTLWTSKSDGSNAKKIGRIASMVLDTDAVPSSLSWLPNGKQVSFYLGDKLYAASVE